MRRSLRPLLVLTAHIALLLSMLRPTRSFVSTSEKCASSILSCISQPNHFPISGKSAFGPCKAISLAPVSSPPWRYRHSTRCWGSTRSLDGKDSDEPGDKGSPSLFQTYDIRNVTTSKSPAGDDSATRATLDQAKKKSQSRGDIHDSPLEAAKHQVEHRAKEKTSVELSRMLTERALDAAERATTQSAERVTERAVQRSAEQAVSRAGEKTAQRAAERVGERVAERAAERTAERVGDHAIERGAEKIAERAAERALERGVERVGEHSVGKAAERATERVGERAIERGIERVGERLGERTAQRTGERAAEGIGARISERGLARGTDRAGEYALAASGQISERFAVSGERLLGVKSEKVLERFYERVVAKAIARAGRGLLVALPALGGLFALWMYRMDYQRSLQERTRGIKNLFRVAAVGDVVDAACHFLLAYAILKGWDHSIMMQFEKCSILCAVTSTIMAVAGEILCYRLVKKNQVEQKNSNGGTAP